jgi:hypothetical protein
MGEGIYENRFVKKDGKWQFASVHFYPTFQSDFDAGWGKNARPAVGINAALPPDRPPTEVCRIYPKPHVPPYHYRNPVTGKAPTYRASIARSVAAACRRRLDYAATVPVPRLSGDLSKALDRAETEVSRFRTTLDREPAERLRLLPGQEPLGSAGGPVCA